MMQKTNTPLRREEALTGRDRVMLEDALYQRFVGGNSGGRLHFRYLRKKYAWRFAVKGAALIKRTVDIAVSLLAIIALMPLFVGVALCIKMTDRGPVFFIQRRVGRYGREFDFPKFRSMLVNAEALKKKIQEQNVHGKEGVTFKMKRDPRVTWIGRFIRKTSVDEMPQLWCVLTGQMSLVGPRPPTPDEVARYTLTDRRRLDVIPGLTCFWQVSGRSDIPFDKQVLLDVQYIESQSFWTDVMILLRTVPAVLFGKGAY
jgi:lipopolysaccharide/colanic/teichoic acid biosynthesis glycosyltransferase